MSENPTNRKAVEDLAVGDYISDNTGVHELVHNLRYSNGDGNPMQALTLRPLGKGDPWVGRYTRGVKLHLATDDEVREFHDAGRRLAAATALHQLADDIVGKQLPLPKYTLSFSAGVLESREALDRWAEYLGAEVKGGVAGDLIPSVGTERPVADSLSISIRAQSRPVPEPEPIVIPAAAVDAMADRAAEVTAEAADLEPVVEFARPVGFASDIDQAERDALTAPVSAEDERVWVFTFGSGQEHDGMYVLIHGTFESARAEMVRVFGNRWSNQYESTDAAGVKEFGLTRLPEALWPEPGADAATPAQQAGE